MYKRTYNTNPMLEIPDLFFLSQNIIIFAVKEKDIAISSFLFRDACAENVNVGHKCSSQREKTVGRPRNLIEKD